MAAAALQGQVDDKRLAGRVEVELDAARHAQLASHAIPFDRPPAGDCLEGPRLSLIQAAQHGEIAVVAGTADDPTDTRVNQPVGALGGVKGHIDSHAEQHRDADPIAGGTIDAAQLAIGPKTAENIVRVGDEAARLPRAPAQAARRC